MLLNGDKYSPYILLLLKNKSSSARKMLPNLSNAPSQINNLIKLIQYDKTKKMVQDSQAARALKIT